VLTVTGILRNGDDQVGAVVDRVDHPKLWVLNDT
jgi:hypothetical protein